MEDWRGGGIEGGAVKQPTSSRSHRDYRSTCPSRNRIAHSAAAQQAKYLASLYIQLREVCPQPPSGVPRVRPFPK
jgi:hypothetical protein